MDRPTQLDEYLKQYKVGKLKITDTITGEETYDDIYDAGEMDLDKIFELCGRG